MNKGFEELNQFGIKGIAAFWLRCLLFLLPILSFILSIYWMAKSSNKIWMSSVGGSILTANIFLLLISLGSFAFLLLCCLNKPIFYSVDFMHHLFAILSFMAQFICCILMSLSNSSKTDRYLRTIEDYCERNPTNNFVIKFISSNPSYYSRFKYVAQRSTDLYPLVSLIFGIWFAATVIYLICSSGLSDTPPEHSPLLSNHHQQQEIQQESEHQSHNQGQEQPAQQAVQPWVLDDDNEHDDNIVNNDPGEVNIMTNSNKPTQNTSNIDPDWAKQPENEKANINKNNPSWVAPSHENGAIIPNYDYSYEEEEEEV